MTTMVEGAGPSKAERKALKAAKKAMKKEGKSPKAVAEVVAAGSDDDNDAAAAAAKAAAKAEKKKKKKEKREAAEKQASGAFMCVVCLLGLGLVGGLRRRVEKPAGTRILVLAGQAAHRLCHT
jgi:hypothetical protein